MTETTPFSLDTDVDTETSDDEEETKARVLHDERDDEPSQQTSCLAELCGRGNSNEPLSIQSGDIIRQNQPPNEVPKSGFYAFLFPYVHKFVKIIFYHQKVPIIPLILMFASVILAVTLGVIALLVFPPSVSLTLESFKIPDHISSIHWDAYQAAMNGFFANAPWDSSQHVSKRSLEKKESRGFSGTLGITPRGLEEELNCPPIRGVTQHRIFSSWYIDIVFKVPGGVADKNLLTPERIRFMHEIEEHIYTLPDYQYMCHQNTTGVCDPINSLLTYLYPRHPNGSYIYTSSGGLVPDVRGTLQNLFSSENSITLWYTGGQVGPHLSATLLRAQILTGVPLRCYYGEYDRKEEQHQKVVDFFISVAHYLDGASSRDVEVLYGGPDIFDYEVAQAISHDAKLAIPSGIVIYVLMFVLTGFSMLSTIVGLVAIISSFPLAFFVYRVVLGIESVGILNVISLFVIIGIGVDDVFVFMNTFKQSKELVGLDSIHKRLTHTIIVAGKATFFTSLTTAVAFFANAVSMIPAVKQFGIFMGWIVLFCYLQVAIIMPLYLHVWHCWILPIENFVYGLSLYCLGLRKKRSIAITVVRMSDLADSDSGIDLLEHGNGSEESENSSTGSGSDSSTERNGTEMLGSSSSLDQDDDKLLEMQLLPTEEAESSANVQTTQSVADCPRHVEGLLTVWVQTFMLKFIARPVLILRLWKPKLSCIHYDLPKRVLRVLICLGSLWLFLLIVKGSVIAMVHLKLSDHPPRFFDTDTNIQKMLDLSGNLTELSTYNCWNCSHWYTGTNTSYVPTEAPPSVPGHPPTGSSTPSSEPATHSTTPSHTPPSSTSATTASSSTTSDTPSQSTPTTHTQPPHTSSSETTPSTQQPSTQQPSTEQPSTQQPSTQQPSTQQPSTQPSSTDAQSTIPTPYVPGNNSTLRSPKFTNNVTVFAVFGISGVKRNYSTSHVLPEDGEGNYAVLDPAFNGNFSCPRKPGSIDLLGTVKALCRICKNISNPLNGLVLNHNAECFPNSMSYFLSCLGISDITHLSECSNVLFHNSSVKAVIRMDYSSGSSLIFLAMAFRSTTFPSGSPFENFHHYEKWEQFIANELEEIRKHSGPGEIYEGAYRILSSGYQTSEYWVEMNTELIAVYGSIYGIVLSFLLCSVVVVLLSHNWRIVTAMFLSILSILLTLLGLFTLFGWELGIVEAISLSILVGNSLDYCIHLTEGYLATDSRHLAFVEKFRFANGAPIRVKRVMAAISFIGVSIISSALTTIIATMPLLGTEIRLFTRFGEILLLDTFVAIVYTFVFCSAFLSYWGPKNSKFSVINAVLTISLTFLGYGVLFLALYIATLAGMNIPTPSGGSLFK